MNKPEFSDTLCFAYGQAVYKREGRAYQGTAILTPHKLYLKNDDGADIAATFIPLEKVYRIRVLWNTLEVYVHPSNFMHFKACLKMTRKNARALVNDLAQQRGLRKKFLGLEWYDPDFFGA